MKLVRNSPPSVSSPSSHVSTPLRATSGKVDRLQIRPPAATSVQADARPLPRPRRGSGSRLLVVVTLLALLAVGAVGYWVTRNDDERRVLRQEAQAFLLRTTRGTPLERLTAGFLPAEDTLAAVAVPASPVLPPEGSPAADGSLSGQVIAAPVTPPPVPAELLPAPPQLRSDDRVTPAFVGDMARFFVSRHAASAAGGPLPLSVQQLNQHYGARLVGLVAAGNDIQARRAAILRYAFHPAMLQALYDIYADRFLDAVIREAMHPAQGKGLSEAETRRLCMAAGGRLVLLAGALDGVRKTPDMRTLLAAVEERGQETQAAMERMQGEMLRVDELQARGADAVAIARGRLAVDREAAAYRTALQGREEALRAIAAAVRQHGGQGLDDATLLYMAEWVDRRLRADADAGEAVSVAARLLRDLGRRFAQAGTQGLPEPLEQRLAREYQEALAAAQAARAAAAAAAETVPKGIAVPPAEPSSPPPGVSVMPPVSPAPAAQERLLPYPPKIPAGGALTPPSLPSARPAEVRP